MSLSIKSKRFVLKTERSDYGKAVRRAYERGEMGVLVIYETKKGKDTAISARCE